MRFLLVDDDPGKIDALVRELCGLGIERSCIVCCDSVSSARRALDEAAFDAMFLDVLLPLRSDSVAAGVNSLEFLRQIIDDGTPSSPRYILGVTADPSALQEFEAEFRSMTLQIIHVSPAQEEWKSFLQSFVLFMRRAKAAELSYDYDIVVLDALRTPELGAVLQYWPLQLTDDTLLNNSVVYRSGVGLNQLANKRVACAFPAQVGPIAAAHAAESVIRHFRPRILLMTGICGGFSDQVRLGDVIIAERSWDWQAGKWTDAGVLLPSIDQRVASAKLLAHARTISLDDTLQLSSQFVGAKPTHQPRLVFGSMVTGSSVVASTDIQSAFRTQHRKMVGVDMECFGLYYAAAMAADPRTEVLCVKSVSDLADRDKEDSIQEFCSFMSAMVGLRVLEKALNALI